jgi:hypothetical protein
MERVNLMDNTLIQIVLMIAASQYVIKNNDTGEVENSGTTVRYVPTDTLTACEDTEKSIKGFKPAKANMPFDCYATLPAVPGVYEARMGLSVASDGTTTVKVQDFKFLHAVTVTKATSTKGS